MTDTIEQAKAKYPYNHWWEKVDENCILHQLNEDILLIQFKDFHKGVEELLGRPVHTHEFACPSLLVSEYKMKLLNDVREKARFAVSIHSG